MAVTDDNASFDCETTSAVSTDKLITTEIVFDTTQLDFSSEHRETELSLSFARRHLYVDDDGNPLSVLQRLWRALKSGRLPFSRLVRKTI